MYHPGDVLDVTLHGLPGLGAWTLQAQALVLDVSTFSQTNIRLLLQDPHGAAAAFARGPLLIAPDDNPFIDRPVADGPTPERIALGRITGHYAHPRGRDGMNELNAHACTALRGHQDVRGTAPLRVGALPALDLVVGGVRRCRETLAEAEATRNSVVQRLRAGGVEPRDMVRPGLSASRISQITKPEQATACA